MSYLSGYHYNVLVLCLIINGISMQILPGTQQQLQQPQQVNLPTNNTPVVNVTECKLVQAKPIPVVHKFSLKNTQPNGTVCLLTEFSSTIFLNNTTPQYLSLGDGKVNTNSSKCNSSTGEALLVVDFQCGQLSLKVEGNQTVAIKDLHGYWFYTTNVNGTITKSDHYDVHHDGTLTQTTKAGFYYRCNSDQYIPLNITNSPPSPVVNSTGSSLLVSNIGIDAFSDSTAENFYKPPEVCLLDAGPTNDLVPIAVGACLAALVVIVLIAYFVGRRRWSERSTYESV